MRNKESYTGMARPMTVGKKIGLFAFIEFQIVCLVGIYICRNDPKSVVEIIFYMLIAFLTVWGAKSISNVTDLFAKKFDMLKKP